MFGTLCLEKTKKRFKKNIRIEQKNVGDVEFIKITCFKKVNPKKIERKIKGKIDKIILSDNIENLQFNNIEIYKNNCFLKNIAQYTFKNIIRLSDIPANKLSICICDNKAEFCDFTYSLAKSAAVLKIITDNTEKYSMVSEKIYDDYGMSPIIASEPGHSDLGIDFDWENPKIWFNTPENYVEITKNCVKLGAGLKSFVPKGINQCDFAGVLQEYRDFRRLKLLNADVMIKNDKIYKINKENIKNFLDIDNKYC